MNNKEKIESVGLQVLAAIDDLKKHPLERSPNKKITMYLIDDDCDLELVVTVKPKQSQEQIGNEMFHGVERKGWHEKLKSRLGIK